MNTGPTVSLRPAKPSDCRRIYEWLTQSDLTPSMIGPPLFPDQPVPTWEEFQADYLPHYFDGSNPQRGQCFVICYGDEEVGQINSNLIQTDHSVELDLWLKESSWLGKGIGFEALRLLCAYLHEHYGCLHFYIAPSQRNPRAIRAYHKAGFRENEVIPEWFVPDTEDAVVMRKAIAVLPEN